MTQQHVTSQLLAYHEGTLSDRERRRVTKHLATCASCRAALAEHERLDQLLQMWEIPAPAKSPQRFVDEVRLQLSSRAEKSTVHSRPGLRWWAGAFALLGLLVFVQIAWLMSTGVVSALQLGVGESLGLARGELLGSVSLWQAFSEQSPLATMRQLVAAWETLRWLIVLPLELLGGIVILYWSWLIGWELYRRQRATPNRAS